MNPLQKCKDHSSLQFGRRRSNRFGENRLTGHCGAVFSKQAAPKSYAFFSCHEPLPPSMHCGKHRGGLSSRAPGAESLKHSLPRRVGLPGPKSARSTEFPLRRLAVRGCERTMRSIDEAKRNLRSGFLRLPIGLCGGSYCWRANSSAAGSSRITNPAGQQRQAADYKSAAS